MNETIKSIRDRDDHFLLQFIVTTKVVPLGNLEHKFVLGKAIKGVIQSRRRRISKGFKSHRDPSLSSG